MWTRSSERKSLFVAGTAVACAMISLVAFRDMHAVQHAGAGALLGLALGLLVTAIRSHEF